MLTLLSPAKSLDETTPFPDVSPTRPRLQARTAKLADLMRDKSAEDLRELMDISADLARLNADRYEAFAPDGRTNSARPAVLTFNGDVYRGFDASTLTAEQRARAQDTVRILSGLYGLLRPYDAIQPHRLEMGTRVDTPRGRGLYRFWNPELTDRLADDLEASPGERAVVNLASAEYAKAVRHKRLDAPITQVKFLNVKDGKPRNISFYSKHARGVMARWMVERGVERTDDLRAFDRDWYRFQATEGDTLIFSRPQPAPTR